MPEKYIYTIERTTVWIGRYYYNDQATPWDGAGITLAADNGFGDPVNYLGWLNPHSGGYDQGNYLCGNGWWPKDNYNVLLSGGKTEVVGPTRVIDISVDCNEWEINPGKRGGATASVEYGVFFADPRIYTRRKSSGLPFTNTAEIVAGGLARDDHEAGVLVNVGVPGVLLGDLPPVELVEPTERAPSKKAAYLQITDQNARTDGSGSLITGVIQSKDAVTRTGPSVPPEYQHTLVKLNLGPGYPHPTITVVKKWDEDNNVVMIDPPPLLEGKDIDVEFRPKFGNVIITKHEMEIVPTKVKVSKWKVEEQKMDELTFVRSTRDLDGDDTTSITGGLEAYIEVVEQMVESENEPGLYKGKIRIHAPKNETINKVWIRCFDKGVWGKEAN